MWQLKKILRTSKKTLEYFVHILRANNKDNDEEFFGKEAKSGQDIRTKQLERAMKKFDIKVIINHK